MNNSFDAIVIGAGNNGLVAAALLAKSGQKVLVIERHNQPGGSASTVERFPGFRHDLATHDLGWINPGILSQLGIPAEKLTWAQVDPAVFAPSPDGSLTLWRNIDKTAAEIKRFSESDAQKWPEFIQRMQRLASFLESVYSQPAPDPFTSRGRDGWELLGLGRKLRGLGRQDMVEVVRMIPLSVHELLEDWFETDLLKGVVAAAGITNSDEGPRASGSGLLLLHHLLGQPLGTLRGPRWLWGGVGSLAATLAQAASGFGADIIYAADVERIKIDAERATGVILRNGNEYAAKRVLSSLDPSSTFLRLVGPEHLEPNFSRMLQNIKYRGIRAKVNLTLGELPRFRGAGEALLRGLISISPSLDYLERAHDDTKYGRISQAPYLEVFIPTLTDPSLAPAGQHILSIWMQYAPFSLREGAWDDEQRDRLGNLVIDTLAEYAPNLPGAILQRQVLTPLDLQHELGVSGGNLYHGELTLDQILFMRPLPGWAWYQTPVDALFLCGSGAHPGGGLPGAAGYLAAAQILKGKK